MKAKTLLAIAFVALLAMCCKKEEESISDFIVNDYGNSLILNLNRDGVFRWNDTVYIDVDNDNEDDIMVTLSQSSAGSPWKKFYPLSTAISIAGLNTNDTLSYGDLINDKMPWENEESGENWYWLIGNDCPDNLYIAFKKETSTTVNYGWILPIVVPTENPELPSNQTLTIKKTAYCTTSGKVIYAGQEE